MARVIVEVCGVVFVGVITAYFHYNMVLGCYV